MRITNSMMVISSKTNINGNKTSLDTLNRQMSSQKKITKPSDDPIIAVRSLRLRSSLSAIDQYYERNIPDTESWMDVTDTALQGISEIVSAAYNQTVYGSSDELNQDNRKTILQELQALQEQIYDEGNTDFEGRTVFTGYKTNQKVTFDDAEEAAKASYTITEQLSYLNIETKNYYTGNFSDTTATTLLGTTTADLNKISVPLPEEHSIKRIRLGYDAIEEEGNSLILTYKDGDNTVTATFGADGSVSYTDAENNISYNYTKDGILTLQGYQFEVVEKTDTTQNPPVTTKVANLINPLPDTDEVTTRCVKETNENGEETFKIYNLDESKKQISPAIGSVSMDKDDNTLYISSMADTTAAELLSFQYQVTDNATLKGNSYNSLDTTTRNRITLNKDTGELLLSASAADFMEINHVESAFTYDKIGFDKGELRPENYFTCTNKTNPKHVLQYDNFTEDGEWIPEVISFNIANGQSIQINTEARDVFDCNIRRDMDELIDVVSAAITAQNTYDAIKEKLNSGLYTEEKNTEEYRKLNDWLDAASKQLDYTNQNMHDTFSGYITRFQGYMDKVNLAITDSGSRGERVAMTKTRMNTQQTVYEDLKSRNEDAEISDLVIDYSAAYVAYQAALQAAGKIGKMTLLDYI